MKIREILEFWGWDMALKFECHARLLPDFILQEYKKENLDMRYVLEYEVSTYTTEGDKTIHLPFYDDKQLHERITRLSVQQMFNKIDEVLSSMQAKDKVIFNPPATILYKDGKKYVSKCDSADDFDEEKGLMLCLLKSHGYTYTDIERLLKSAKRFNKGDKQ